MTRWPPSTNWPSARRRLGHREPQLLNKDEPAAGTTSTSSAPRTGMRVLTFARQSRISVTSSTRTRMIGSAFHLTCKPRSKKSADNSSKCVISLPADGAVSDPRSRREHVWRADPLRGAWDLATRRGDDGFVARARAGFRIAIHCRGPNGTRPMRGLNTFVTTRVTVNSHALVRNGVFVVAITNSEPKPTVIYASPRRSRKSGKRSDHATAGLGSRRPLSEQRSSSTEGHPTTFVTPLPPLPLHSRYGPVVVSTDGTVEVTAVAS
jgi:hypothetical protein